MDALSDYVGSLGVLLSKGTQMKMEAIPRMVRGSKRFQEVLAILAKYGLANWLSHANLDWIQRHFRTADGENIADLSEGAKLRLAFTELGTTFIKLGQILSTRPDLVGPDIMCELAHLQSGTPADPPAVVREILTAELGEDFELAMVNRSLVNGYGRFIHVLPDRIGMIHAMD